MDMFTILQIYHIIGVKTKEGSQNKVNFNFIIFTSFLSTQTNF
jgi:hypothetical protein